MSHNTKKREQRVRVTNKALESRQFSTIKAPRKSEISKQKVNVESLYNAETAHEQFVSTNSDNNVDNNRIKNKNKYASLESKEFVNKVTTHLQAKPPSKASLSSSTFDPIPNDTMFIIVNHSKYWPPPSLDELTAQTGISVTNNDGFDLYDRVEDDVRAKKEHVRLVKGELNHPRGKPRQNTITHFDDSSSDDDDDNNTYDKEQRHYKK